MTSLTGVRRHRKAIGHIGPIEELKDFRVLKEGVLEERILVNTTEGVVACVTDDESDIVTGPEQGAGQVEQGFLAEERIDGTAASVGAAAAAGASAGTDSAAGASDTGSGLRPRTTSSAVQGVLRELY